MSDKSGGDILQANAAMQGNMSGQAVNSIASAGLGAVDSMGGSAMSAAMGSQTVNQGQTQSNSGSAGDGGNDNVNANDTFNL